MIFIDLSMLHVCLYDSSGLSDTSLAVLREYNMNITWIFLGLIIYVTHLSILEYLILHF